MGFWLTWLFGCISIVGIVLTVYYGRKSIILKRTRKKLEWTEIQTGTSELSAKIKREYTPELILTPGLRGSTIANLFLNVFDTNIPTFVGISYWKENKKESIKFRDYIHVSTQKWNVYIPKEILEFTDKKLLIIDDFAMSGDFLEKIKKLLISNGYSSNNIKTFCITTTNVAISNKKAPDFYWMITENDNFYFPWGKAK